MTASAIRCKLVMHINKCQHSHMSDFSKFSSVMFPPNIITVRLQLRKLLQK